MKPEVRRILEEVFPGEEARYFAPISIGSTPSAADAGVAAVLDGTKTVTSSAFWDWPDGRIPFAAAHELLLIHLNDAVPFALGLLEIRLLHTELRTRASHLRFERRRIDPEQQVAFLHARPFLIHPLQQDAGDARANLDFANATQLGGMLERQCERLRLHLE